MYAISRSANLTLPIRDRKVNYHPGTTQISSVEPAVSVQFQHSGSVPDYAKEAVSKMADWGRGIGLNEDPFEYCGCFDTDAAAISENWSPETKAMVEDVLRRGSGVLYVVAEPDKAERPWPNYDTLHTDDDYEAAFAISKKVSEDGYDPKVILQYESENQNRELVKNALELLVKEAEVDVLGVIPA